jgi:hypothetical protein
MDLMFWLEVLSHAVTIVGLPFALVVFVLEQRKARRNEEDALYQSLAEAYTEFMALVLEHADLKLLTRRGTPTLDDEQRERQRALFDTLLGLFEQAFMLVYDAPMSKRRARLWQTWEDYLRGWCRREDFREALPSLLEGEDRAFRAYVMRLLQEEMARDAASRER